MPKRADTLAGTLDLLILKTLSREPNHGFGITLHIQEVSKGLVQVEEGSLYPALHRLEREGLLSGEWQVTPNGRRARFYTLSPNGHKRLAEAQTHWTNLSEGVQRVLQFAL
jgi:transcriptional regulator